MEILNKWKRKRVHLNANYWQEQENHDYRVLVNAVWNRSQLELMTSFLLALL